jgi:hypothetical protein
MSDAVLATIVMLALGGTVVAVIVAVDKRHKRICEQRRRRWAAMGFGDLPTYSGGAVLGDGLIAGGFDGGGRFDGGGCGGGGCGGGGCGGGG